LHTILTEKGEGVITGNTSQKQVSDSH